MPAESADRPNLDPDDIAAQSFTKVRKGFEVDEVRAYLVGLGSQVRDLQRHFDDATRRLDELERRAEPPDALEELDEERLTQLLGEETVRVLDTARKAAAELKAKAEDAAAEERSSAATEAGTVREAADQYAQGVRSDADAYAAEIRSTAEAEVATQRSEAEAETSELRAAAETLLDERTAEADEAAQSIRSEADAYAEQVRADADTYVAEQRTAADIYASNTRDEADQITADADTAAAARRTEAEAEAEAVVAAAREQGRAMVEEARTYRERVIADLADRRRAARGQLEELAATRDALSVTLTDVAARVSASHQAVAAAVIDPAVLGDVASDRAALAASDPPPASDVADEDGDGDPADPEAESSAPEAMPDEDEAPPADPVAAEVEADAEPEPEPEPESDPDPEPEAETDPENDPETDPENDPETDPENDPETDPEPEPEPVAEAEADPDPEAAGGGSDPVDAVFAQLKAQQAGTEVVEAETAPARGAVPAPADASGAEAETELEAAPDDTDVDGDQAVLDRRDSTTDDLERQLARRLKRVLSDEQNEALDRLRTSKGDPDVEVVLLSPGEHLGRYHEAALQDLVQAERAGAGFFGEAPGRSADVGDVAEEFAADLVRQLRGRLEAAFDDGGDEQEVSDRIRSCYREWKTQRIAEAAKHYVLVAFNRGMSEAAVDGSAARWVVDDGDTPCPDCDDNALAGAVGKGEAFPTGDRHPPAHPGCRCLAVPA